MKTLFPSFQLNIELLTALFSYHKATVEFFQTLGLCIFVAKDSFQKDENRINWENSIFNERVIQFNFSVIINKTAR